MFKRVLLVWTILLLASFEIALVEEPFVEEWSFDTSGTVELQTGGVAHEIEYIGEIYDITTGDLDGNGKP
ncbi:MAG: hypothetical protein ACE5K0_11975, partial [Candidatus Methanofastidiosia archaeon]